MFSQILLSFHMQTSYRKLNNLKVDIRCLSKVAAKENEQKLDQTKLKLPVRYPGYEIIYKYRFIHYASLINRWKLRIMIISGIVAPSTVVLQQLNILSSYYCYFILYQALTITWWFFMIGLLCNNLIGFIYVKDNELVKIAYVNFWGKRIDIDTRLADIDSDVESLLPTRFLYKKIHISPHKKAFKLPLHFGIINNKQQVQEIVGYKVNIY